MPANTLYFLPLQRVDYVEQISNSNFGVNLLNPFNEQDFEDGDFAYFENKEIPESEIVDNFIDVFEIKNFAKKPEFASEYQVTSETPSTTQFEQKISYRFYEQSIPGYPNDTGDLIDPDGIYDLENVESESIDTYYPDEYPIEHRIQYNSTETVDDSSSYDIYTKETVDAIVNVDEQDLISRFHVSNIEYRSDGAVGTDWLPLDLIAAPTQEVEIESNYYSNLDKGSADSLQFTTLGEGNDFEINIKGLGTGNYEFRFTLEFEKIRWEKEVIREDEQDIYTGFLILKQTEPSTKKQVVIENYIVTPAPFVSWKEIKNKPYEAKKVFIHNESLIVYDSERTPQTIYGSLVDNPFYFPQRYRHTFENDLQEKINVITPFMEVLVVQSDSYTWGMKGDSFLQNFNPFQFFNINTAYGCIAPKTARPVRNQLFFLSKEGIASLNSLYAIDNQYNVKMMDRNIFNIVPLDKDAIAIQNDNQYWIHFPSEPDNMTLRYYYDKKAWVKDTYEQFAEFTGIHRYYNEGNTLRIITKPMKRAEGEATAIFDMETNKELANDLGFELAPRTTFTTSFLNQNYPFHPKKFKEAKFDFTLQNEYLIEDKTVKKIDESFQDTGAIYFHQFKAELERGHTYVINYFTGLTFDVNDEDSPYADDTFAEIEDGDSNSALLEIIPRTGASGPKILPFRLLNGTLVFTVPNDMPDTEYIVEVRFVLNRPSLYDVNDFVPQLLPFLDITYDKEITFNIDIENEKESLLNDNYGSYSTPTDTSEEEVSDFNVLEGKFGEVSTLVKTVKLNGKGYNIKVSFDDRSKTKWVMESLGLTYKMRKARSR